MEKLTLRELENQNEKNRMIAEIMSFQLPPYDSRLTAEEQFARAVRLVGQHHALARVLAEGPESLRKAQQEVDAQKSTDPSF